MHKCQNDKGLTRRLHLVTGESADGN